jgi:hypothetical protein
VAIRLLLLVALLGFPALTVAHHSRANFAADTTVEISGTLQEFVWRNPHVYLKIDAPDASGEPQSWLIEAHSITGMKGHGWSKETLSPGAQVTVVGRPDRNPNKRYVLMSYVQMADGSQMFAMNRNRQQGRGHGIPPSLDFSGTWTLDLSTRDVLLAGGPPDDWPYTELGQELALQYDRLDDPENDCEPVGLPQMTLYPYGTNWSRETDRIVIEKEHLDEQRIIYLDVLPPEAADAPASYVGTSVGRFESERHLVVETTGFLATRWGIMNGIDSSGQKKVTESFMLAADGLVLDLSYVIEDPVYLTEPVTVSGRLLKAPNRAFTRYGCDSENARQHLDRSYED